MPLTNFVIIGAQKSTSTLIQKIISKHPGEYITKGEAAFFESPDYEDLGGEYLESLFNNRAEKILGIKRASYIGLSGIADRIYTDLLGVKLLAILRNPFDRMLSAYFHNIKSGFIPALAPDVGLKMLLDEPDYSAKYP